MLFLTCSCRFLISKALEQLEFKLEKLEKRIYNIFIFLGTPPENIKSICKSNLNVIRRTAHGGGYYFSEHPQLSLGYGRGKQI